MDFFATAVRLWMEPVQTESWRVLERGLIAVAVSRFSKIRYATGALTGEASSPLVGPNLQDLAFWLSQA